MFLNKKYSAFGLFQMPVNIIGIFLLVFGVGWIIFNLIFNLYEFVLRVYLIDNYIFNYIFSSVSLKNFLLNQDLFLVIPLLFATLITLITIYLAHKMNSEKALYYPLSFMIYIFVYPYITFIHWVAAIFYEVFKFKKKW